MNNITKKIKLVSLAASITLGGFASLPMNVLAKEGIQATATDTEGYTFIGSVETAKQSKNKVDLVLQSGEKIRFTFLDKDLFRLYMAPDGEDFKEYPTPNSVDHKATITVASDDEFYAKNNVEPTLVENDTIIQIKTDALVLEINKETSIMKLTKTNGEIVWEEAQPLRYKKGSTYQTLKTSADEFYYGGGTQNGRFSHKGEVIAVKNTNNWVDKGVASPNPFYWSTKGYGVVRNTWKPGSYDFDSKGQNVVTTKHDETRYDAYYFVGDTPQELLSGYYDLTGTPVELPEYASYLGHLNCYNRDYWTEVPQGTAGAVKLGSKWYKEDSKTGSIKETLNGSAETTAEQIIRDHKDNDMPLGWFLPNDGYGCGYGQTATLDGDVQNLGTFASNALAKGVRTGLWTQSNLWPKDQSKPQKGERDIYKEVDAGVVAVKTDVAWVGNGYSMALNGISVAYDAITKNSGLKANIVSLDGWAGTQRYAGIWTGDQYGGKWEYIRFHIPTYIGTSLSGQPNVGSDMDGIFGGKNTTVWTRDFQWKAFTTYMLDMDGWGSNQKSPYALGEDGTSINRSYLKLKAMLMPYNNTMSHEATVNQGLPMIRAMFLEDPNAYTYSSKTQYQYMWGDNFVIAPIYQDTASDAAGNDIRNDIYLPSTSDVWIDYFTGEQYEGGRIINNFDAPIWKLPVFVRNGAIIPMYAENNNPIAKSAENTDGLDRSIRRAEFYPSGDTEFEVYEDDGITLGGAGTTTKITSSVVGDVATLKTAKTNGTYTGMVDKRSNEYIVNVSKAPSSVTGNVAGKDVTFTSVNSKEEYEAATGNVYFYDENPSIFVKEFASAGSTYENTDKTTAPKLYVKSTDKVSIHNYDYTVVVNGFANDQGLVKDVLDTTLTIPTNIRGENIEDLSFTAVWDDVVNATGYDVEIFDGVYVNNPQARYEVVDLDYDTEYTFRVRTRVDNTYSEWSDYVTVRTNVDRYRNVVRNLDVTWKYGDSHGALKNGFDFDQGTMFHSSNAVTEDQQMIIDMGAAYTMDKFTYQPRMDNKGNGAVEKMNLYASVDGVTYEKVWDGDANPAWTYNKSDMSVEDVKEIPLNNKKIRFFKIGIISSTGGFFSASELMPYKVEGTGPWVVGDANNSGELEDGDLMFFENYIGLNSVDADWEYTSVLANLNGNDILDGYDLSFVARLLGTPVKNAETGADGKLMLVPSKTDIKAGDVVNVDVYGIGLKNVNTIFVEFPIDTNTMDVSQAAQPSISTIAMRNFSKLRKHSDNNVDNYIAFTNVGQQQLLNGSGTVATFSFTATADFTWNHDMSRAQLVGQDLTEIDARIDESQTPQVPETVNVLNEADIKSIKFSNSESADIPGADLWQQSDWKTRLFDGDKTGELAEFKWYHSETDIPAYVMLPTDMEFTLNKAEPVSKVVVHNRKSSNGSIKKIKAVAYNGTTAYDLGTITNPESTEITFSIPAEAKKIDRIVITPMESSGSATGTQTGTETNRMLSIHEIEIISDATVKATGIAFADDAISEMNVGALEEISAVVLPNNASNPLYEITSSDIETVRVNKVTLGDHYAYVLEALKEGTVTLTATSEDGNFSATHTLHVVKGIDATELQKAINTFDALPPQLYTADTYNAVKVLVDQAKVLLTGDPTQAEVNTITIQIANASKLLKLKGSNEEQPTSTNIMDLSDATLFYETSFTSAEKEHGDLAFDGDITTFWHSNYGSSYKLPQYIVVDLGDTYNLEQINMLARQNSRNGGVTHYRVEVSTTEGDNLTIDDLDFYPVVEGYFETENGELVDRAKAKEIKFDTVEARYVKFIALESVGSSADQANRYASIAELTMFGKKSVTFEILQDVLAEVDGLNEDDYTSSTWSDLMAAYDVANALTDTSSKEDIKAAITDLKSAQTALTRRASNIALTSLKDKIAKCEALEGSYTTSDFAAMKALLVDAKALIAKGDADISSTEATAMLLALVNEELALGELSDVYAMRSTLAMVVELAGEELANATNIRPGKITQLTNALAAGQALLDAESKDVAAMEKAMKDINAAVEQLWEIVNKSDLETIIDTAKDVEADGYTVDSYKALQDAIAAGEIVAANDDATTTEVADATQAIYDAIANLERETVLNKTALINEIALSETIVAASDRYVPSSIKNLPGAIDVAKAALASATTQQELDDATKALMSVRMKARLKADTAALRALKEKVEAMNLDGYTASSVMGVKNALAHAANVISDPEVSQDVVDTALAGLQNAVDALTPITTTPGGDDVNTPKPGDNGNGVIGNPSVAPDGSVNSGDTTDVTSLYGLLALALMGLGVLGRKKYKNHEIKESE
ncbi:alpha-glucosidase (family GH31 glycosyl hydrolase) [Breznakia blatticola]|uniref:Alpha-glucosidase (Family GH31 glycosyl hydrolase) n=1 Tax=Breznakia blatticola TaxID=1754012 RepID=A0A4R7ZIB2_9FIRM|nr:discoidin domain-containing protein [Breznakia blatticola]TDW16846.1 alpha-glucosidase (family GH31 glycosyl hydrolase) [Breznakia blatticola]